MILTTPAGRRISAEAETDARLGRVFYRVDKVGTFTFEHANFREEDYGSGRLYVMYGHVTDLFGSSSVSIPAEPVVVFGVTLTGGWVFNAAEWLAPEQPGERWRYYGGRVSRWLGPCRSESAPDGTRKRTVDMVLALARDFLDRPDSLALAHAGEVVRAPGRLMGEQRQIAGLRESIAKMQVELDEHLRLADTYLALIPSEEADRAA